MCFEQVKAKKKNEIFMFDFILFLKNKIRAIFYLEYMSSVFTFVHYIFILSFASAFNLDWSKFCIFVQRVKLPSPGIFNLDKSTLLFFG